MKEYLQDIVTSFPAGLKPQDRLSLEMAVADTDIEEASRLIKDYGVGIPNDSTPMGLCQDWFARIKRAEKHHCQNIIDLHSQGVSIGGMQALATSAKKEVSL